MSMTVAKETALAAISDPVLGPAEQAAVVLALLDEKSLSALAGRLSPANKTRFSAALERLSSVGPKEQQAVAAAFAKGLAARRGDVKGGATEAARLSRQLYAPDPNLEGPAEAEAPKTFWERVEGLGVETVADFLAKGPIPAAATALGALPEAFAADVIAKLPDDTGVRSVVELSSIADTNPVALEAVEAMIGEAFFGTKATAAPVDTDRADRIAGLLNRMTTAKREAVLAALPDAVDEAMLAAVKERVLGFDDLATRLPRNVVPVIFREVPEPQLLEALSYANRRASKTAEYLFANISQRLAAQIKERLPANVSEDDGEKAQAGIVGFILSLVAKGETELLDAAGN